MYSEEALTAVHLGPNEKSGCLLNKLSRKYCSLNISHMWPVINLLCHMGIICI